MLLHMTQNVPVVNQQTVKESSVQK